jgi:hypothetical protein
MRPLIPALIQILVLVSGLATAAAHGATPQAGRPGPVLVELFTSEGCSSCPPADAFLAELEGTHTASGAEVIVAGEHVDYWNNLGWADPYSSPAFSQRQRAYAASLRQSTVYTPQVVVDGTDERVGSDRGEVRQAIATAAARPKARVSLAPAQVSPPDAGQGYALQISIDGLHPGSADGPAALYLAITEDGLQSRVTRGENAGRLLTHVAVVRRLTRVAVLDRGRDSYATTVRVPLDPAWKGKALRAVAFLQAEGSGHILGAASSACGPS